VFVCGKPFWYCGQSHKTFWRKFTNTFYLA
jgi:hypothetical protein